MQSDTMRGRIGTEVRRHCAPAQPVQWSHRCPVTHCSAKEPQPRLPQGANDVVPLIELQHVSKSYVDAEVDPR